jgi:hypothetical protein
MKTIWPSPHSCPTFVFSEVHQLQPTNRLRSSRFSSGERTRPRVPISAPRRNASLVRTKPVIGEAPTTAREGACAPRKKRSRDAHRGLRRSWKVSAGVLTIFLTAVTGSLASDFWPVEYSFEETYVGEASVTRGSRRVQDFDESDTLLRLILTPRVKLGVLRLGFEYEQFSFGLSKNAPLPNTLQSVAAVVGIDTQLSDSILVRLEATPGVYSEAFRAGSNVFNMPFEIGGTYIYNPDLQFVLGVSIDVERKYPVIPGGGIRWKFQPKWVLNAVLPTPRLEYEWNKNLTLYAGANIKETNFRVSDDFGREHGIPRLNHAVLTYSEIRAGGGIDWKVTSWLSVNAEAGYQPYRNFDFYRANIRYHEDGSAPYGMIALHGAF